jgi:hypothetical protein
MRTLPLGLLLALPLAVGLPRAATAEEAPSPAERSAEVRARLGAPEKPLRFEGDISLSGRRIGRVRWSAEPSEHEGKPTWLVRERFIREGGAARVAEESEFHLGADLSVLAGTSTTSTPTAEAEYRFERSESGVRVRSGPPGGRQRFLGIREGTHISMGTAALLLFLRAVPEEPATWSLPLLEPSRVEDERTAALSDLALEVLGASTGRVGDEERPTWKVRSVAASGEARDLHFDPATRELLRIEGAIPRLLVVPAGHGGAEPEWFDRVEEPSRDAHEAFVKFGRGYHIPRRDLLEAAFHWPSMLEHEKAAGTWDPARPIEEFRDAWVAEFVGMSKHRALADCDDLLMQTLLFAQETVAEDGRVRIATHPAYGGHVYTLAPVEGTWFIVAVD